MVLSKDLSQASIHRRFQKLTKDDITLYQKYDPRAPAAIKAVAGGNMRFIEKMAKKNELLYPISPYDEIPTIRDLFMQLSPNPSYNSGVLLRRKEVCQERQDIIEKNQSSHRQQDRTAPPIDRSRVFPKFIDDAHEVPITIEVPSNPSFSGDSELSFEESANDCQGNNHGQWSLSPHSPPDFGVEYQVDKELAWPSDEESLSGSNRKVMMKTCKENSRKFHLCHRV